MVIKSCPVCKNEPASISKTLGVLPGEKCQQKRKNERLSTPVEFTSEQIKEDRKLYSKDIIQPFRSGTLSKEYISTYGTKGIDVSKEDIKNAINTTDSYYD